MKYEENLLHLIQPLFTGYFTRKYRFLCLPVYIHTMIYIEIKKCYLIINGVEIHDLRMAHINFSDTLIEIKTCELYDNSDINKHITLIISPHRVCVDNLKELLAKARDYPTFDNFDSLQTLHVGKFGILMKSGPLIIKKMVCRSQKSIKSIINEISISIFLSENYKNYFVKLHSVFRIQNHIFMVSDHKDIDLFYYLRDDPECDIRKRIQIIYDIAVGMKIIHNHRIIHRDLKPENCVMDYSSGKIYIIDFGLSCLIPYDGFKKYTICGTEGFMSPEMLRKKGYSFSTDFWSFGILLLAILPFDRIINPKLKKDMKKLTLSLLHHDVSTRENNWDNILNNRLFDRFEKPDISCDQQLAIIDHTHVKDCMLCGLEYNNNS
jgi:serine/threonine protein kinase